MLKLLLVIFVCLSASALKLDSPTWSMENVGEAFKDENVAEADLSLCKCGMLQWPSHCKEFCQFHYYHHAYHHSHHRRRKSIKTVKTFKIAGMQVPQSRYPEHVMADKAKMKGDEHDHCLRNKELISCDGFTCTEKEADNCGVCNGETRDIKKCCLLDGIQDVKWSDCENMNDAIAAVDKAPSGKVHDHCEFHCGTGTKASTPTGGAGTHTGVPGSDGHDHGKSFKGACPYGQGESCEVKGWADSAGLCTQKYFNYRQSIKSDFVYCEPVVSGTSTTS